MLKYVVLVQLLHHCETTHVHPDAIRVHNIMPPHTMFSMSGVDRSEALKKRVTISATFSVIVTQKETKV